MYLGGFPIEIESQISKLITYCFAIFIAMPMLLCKLASLFAFLFRSEIHLLSSQLKFIFYKNLNTLVLQTKESKKSLNYPMI